MTKTIDYEIQQGFNDHYVTLERERLPLDPAVSSILNRPRHIQDVPLKVAIYDNSSDIPLRDYEFLGLTNIHPGILTLSSVVGSNFLSFYRTGISSLLGEISPIVIYSDNAPIMHLAELSLNLFDIERVEVSEGLQNGILYKNSFQGAVHLFDHKPDGSFGGYFAAGTGNFGKREIEGVVNVPLVDDLLFIRVGALYRSSNGYLRENRDTIQNGNDIVGGRFSLRFTPSVNHEFNVKFNYRASDEPGKAFLNLWQKRKNFNDLNDEMINPQSKNRVVKDYREHYDIVFTYNLLLSEHNSLTLTSSYLNSGEEIIHKINGRSLPLMLTSKSLNYNSLFHKLSYNFSNNSSTNGTVGVELLKESIEPSFDLLINEMATVDALMHIDNSLMPYETTFPIFSPLYHHYFHNYPFSSEIHSESFAFNESNQSAEAFLYLNHQLNKRLFFNGGVRIGINRMKASANNLHSAGSSSQLGYFTGAYPNMIISPNEPDPIDQKNSLVLGSVGLSYRYNENTHFYLNISRNQKPIVMQYRSDGSLQVPDVERVYGAEIGVKSMVSNRIYWEIKSVFERTFNMQTLLPMGFLLSDTADTNRVGDFYGFEGLLKANLIRGVKLIGNYRFMKSSISYDCGSDSTFTLRHTPFAFTPEHSFTVGIDGSVTVNRNIGLYVRPRYSWRSEMQFYEYVGNEMRQPQYGVMNIIVGLKFLNPDLLISFYGTNILNENYSVAAGRIGGKMGLWSLMTGEPRMVGVRLRWSY